MKIGLPKILEKKDKVRFSMKILGINVYSAYSILAEIDDISRFSELTQITQLLTKNLNCRIIITKEVIKKLDRINILMVV